MEPIWIINKNQTANGNLNCKLFQHYIRHNLMWQCQVQIVVLKWLKRVNIHYHIH